MPWWNYAANKREQERIADERYKAKRAKNYERASKVTKDIYALEKEINGYTDMEFIVFARAVVAEVVRLKERVDKIENN